MLVSNAAGDCSTVRSVPTGSAGHAFFRVEKSLTPVAPLLVCASRTSMNQFGALLTPAQDGAGHVLSCH